MNADGSTIKQVIDRIDQLEEDLEQERDERLRLEAENEALRERVDELESRATVEMDGKNIESLTINDFPVGSQLTNKVSEDLLYTREPIPELESRVTAIEKGQVDPGQLAASSSGQNLADLLEIHQDYVRVRDNPPASVDLSENKERAARIFPHINDKKTMREGKIRLFSNDVREILSEEVATPELENRFSCTDLNANTVKQTMRQIKKKSGGMFEFDTESQKQNFLVADHDEWTDYWESVMDAFDGGGPATADDPNGEGEDVAAGSTSQPQQTRADGGDASR